MFRYIQHPKVSIISNSGSTHVFHQCGRCHNYGHTSTTCVQLLKGNRNKQYLGPGLSIGGGGGHKRGVMKMDRFLKMMARSVFFFSFDRCVLFLSTQKLIGVFCFFRYQCEKERTSQKETPGETRPVKEERGGGRRTFVWPVHGNFFFFESLNEHRLIHSHHILYSLVSLWHTS